MVGFVPEAEDAELSMLTCRRTTFEWVLRRVVLDEGRVIFKTGVGVNGFTHMIDDVSGRKQITGVTLENGTTLAGDLVVVAGGRRSSLPDWLNDIGAGPVLEEVEETGIVYASRFYRLNPDAVYPHAVVRSVEISAISNTECSSEITTLFPSHLRHPPPITSCARNCLILQSLTKRPANLWPLLRISMVAPRRYLMRCTPWPAC